MSVLKYEIINPISLNNKPYIDSKDRLIIPNINPKYKWYLEVANFNQVTRSREYFILFSENKFDDHCRKCQCDFKGRITIIINGEIKNYIYNEISARGNIECTYMYTEDNYDVWQIE